MSEDSTTIWLSTLTAGGHALILRVLAWVAWERSSMQVMDSHPAGLFSRLLLLLYCICLDLLLLFFCFFFILLSSSASSSFMFFLGLTAIFGRRGRLSFWAGEVDCNFVAGGRLPFRQDFFHIVVILRACVRVAVVEFLWSVTDLPKNESPHKGCSDSESGTQLGPPIQVLTGLARWPLTLS